VATVFYVLIYFAVVLSIAILIDRMMGRNRSGPVNPPE
jgi:hypothetical protein